MTITGLEKSSQRTTAVELMAMSNSKSISTCSMRSKLRGLRLSSCVALRKPLISGNNHRNRRLFAREPEDWTQE